MNNSVSNCSVSQQKSKYWQVTVFVVIVFFSSTLLEYILWKDEFAFSHAEDKV